MSKLISGPKVPKDIVVPIKKKRVRKPLYDGVISYTLINETNKDKVNALFELYKKDSYKARVKYFSNKSDYSNSRTVIFHKGNDFEISSFTNTYGISVTNRIYSRQKKVCSIIFKGGKLYHYQNNPKGLKNVRNLTINSLINFIHITEGSYSSNHSYLKEKSKIYVFLLAKFPWIRNLLEHEITHSISFNVVISKKLYKHNDILRHMFKVPINIIKIIKWIPDAIGIDDDEFNYIRPTNRIRNVTEAINQWKEISGALDNVQNLTHNLYHHYEFYDTCKLGLKLGLKVNCSWSTKKLKEMHDYWSILHSNILLDCEEESRLKIQDFYYGLAKYSGWKLLFTNREMLYEGLKQRHCVGSYIDRVEKGECVIFHVEGYTLQVSTEKVYGDTKHWVSVSNVGNFNNPIPLEDLLKKEYHHKFGDIEGKMMMRLVRKQFKGLANENASRELMAKVDTIMGEYSITEEFQDLFNKRKELDSEVISSVLKTRWEVVTDYKENKYYIIENVEAPLLIENIKEEKEVEQELPF